MLFRPRRSGRAGPWLEWKVRIFVTGAVLGLAGIFLKERGLVWAALAVLTVGLVVRLVSERVAESDDEEDDEEELRGDIHPNGPGVDEADDDDNEPPSDGRQPPSTRPDNVEKPS